MVGGNRDGIIQGSTDISGDYVKRRPSKDKLEREHSTRDEPMHNNRDILNQCPDGAASSPVLLTNSSNATRRS